MRRVVGVVAAQLDRRTGLDRRTHDRCQLKAHKVHSRGFFVVFPVQVFVGDGIDAGLPFHLDKHVVLHTDQSGQLTLALIDVGVFDHHGGFPVAAIRHQRGIGLNFLQDAFFFENLFDAQHLLNLVADGDLALELQVDVLAQRHAAQLAVGNDGGLVGLAVLGVGLQRHQAVEGDVSCQLHGVLISNRKPGVPETAGAAAQARPGRLLQIPGQCGVLPRGSQS